MSDKRIYSTDEQLLWLASQMDDCTSGNSKILLDWGNCSIDCNAGSAPSPELKSRLQDLAVDYLRLKKKELSEKQAVL